MCYLEIEHLVGKFKDLSQTKIWLKGKLIDVNVDLKFRDDHVVENTLRDLVTNNGIDAYFAKKKLNKDGDPNIEDLTKAAKLHTVLRFTVS